MTEITQPQVTAYYDSVTKRHDLPREEALKRKAEIKKSSHGNSSIYYKYTCASCKIRCMFGTPDTLYEVGICPVCQHETSITEAGFMVVTKFEKRPKVTEPTAPGTAVPDTQEQTDGTTTE